LTQQSFFLAFGFQASLQTSTVQANNRTTGAAMALIKKADVNQHFAARRAMRRNAFRSVSQPLPAGRTATVPAATGPIVTGPDAPGFAKDFILEHSSPDAPVTSPANGVKSGKSRESAAPGSRTL
jgi:hypothetical protein